MSTRAQCEQVNVNWPKKIDLQRIPQINMASSLVCDKQKAREEHCESGLSHPSAFECSPV